MFIVLPVHIVAGSLGIVTGFVALYASKGGPIHRRIGMAFVVSMLTMTTTGIVVSAAMRSAPALNIAAGLITMYLVITGFTTVKPGPAWLLRACMVLALAVGLTELSFGFAAIANGGRQFGMPAFPFFLFGLTGILGAAGDLRWIRTGAPRGKPRIARHLWRMSFALFIAAMSFFIGQSDEFPKAWRIMPLLALPPLTVLVTMLWWVWRVRRKRMFRTATLQEAVQ
jgi:hypothetical protein